MTSEFAIIGTEDGMRVIAIAAGLSAEVAASAQGGTLVDPGPYATYEEAYDAMFNLDLDDEEPRPAESK